MSWQAWAETCEVCHKFPEVSNDRKRFWSWRKLFGNRFASFCNGVEGLNNGQAEAKIEYTA